MMFFYYKISYVQIIHIYKEKKVSIYLLNPVSELIQKIEASLRQQNSYYDDLINGKVLQSLKITAIKNNGFKTYMKSIGKLGGQNKLPRLSNDRKIADVLVDLKLTK